MPTPTVGPCPPRDILERLTLGQLSPSELERWSRHIDECGKCITSMFPAAKADTLLDEAKKDPDCTGTVGGRISFSTQGRQGDSESDIEETRFLAESADTPVDSGPTGHEFLAPPQALGEIGRLGPYRILKVLGTGGMGVVFLAEDPQLKRQIALKTLKPAVAANARNRQRFLREAQAAALVESDHIVPIYQVGEDRGFPYLAMPLLKGASLEDRLRQGALPVPEIVRVATHIARGLAAAHDRGLIHRDIKPANLWIEPDGRVKILDFGLARAVGDDAQLTQRGLIIGTPAYMAPEQARGEKLDARCDFFSLGCVLYFMCASELPFQGGDTMSILMALADPMPPRPPHAIKPMVPRSLSDLVMQLLEKKPAQRPANAKEVIAALQAVERELQDGGPIEPDLSQVVGAEWKKLAGNWKMVGAETKGKKTAFDESKVLPFTIKEGRLASSKNAKNPVDWQLSLDPRREPKKIDVITGKEYFLGIYELREDMLTICAGPNQTDTRPTDFTAPAGSGRTIYVLKKQAP